MDEACLYFAFNQMEYSEQKIQPVYIRDKRRIWPRVLGILALLALVVVLGISLIFNVILVSSRDTRVAGDGFNFTEKLIEGTGEKKIVIIPIQGLITFSAAESFWPAESMGKQVVDRLRAAGKDPAVAGVILKIDSPGGGITASDVIHQQVSKLREEGKTVVALLEDLAASGGYYVCAPSDLIIAHPTTVTGSIGVIIQSFNLEGLMEKIGLKDVTIKSGEQKDLLSPFRDLTPEEREILQGVVDEMYERFVSIVAEGREMSPEKIRPLADGRIFTGPRARELGLVDMIGYRGDAIAEARRLAELEEARVIEYKSPPSLWNILGANLAESLAPTAQLDLESLFGPGTPRLMYLWAL